MSEMLKYAQRINQLNEKKRLFAENDNPDFLAKRIEDESGELREAINNDAEAFGVGREIGDILYLTFLLCQQLGFDPRDLLDITIERNQVKYPAERLQDGEYHETVKTLRQEWKDRGDDVVWSWSIL